VVGALFSNSGIGQIILKAYLAASHFLHRPPARYLVTPRSVSCVPAYRGSKHYNRLCPRDISRRLRFICHKPPRYVPRLVAVKSYQTNIPILYYYLSMLLSATASRLKSDRLNCFFQYFQHLPLPFLNLYIRVLKNCMCKCLTS